MGEGMEASQSGIGARHAGSLGLICCAFALFAVPAQAAKIDSPVSRGGDPLRVTQEFNQKAAVGNDDLGVAVEPGVILGANVAPPGTQGTNCPTPPISGGADVIQEVGAWANSDCQTGDPTRSVLWAEQNSSVGVDVEAVNWISASEQVSLSSDKTLGGTLYSAHGEASVLDSGSVSADSYNIIHNQDGTSSQSAPVYEGDVSAEGVLNGRAMGNSSQPLSQCDLDTLAGENLGAAEVVAGC